VVRLSSGVTNYTERQEFSDLLGHKGPKEDKSGGGTPPTWGGGGGGGAWGELGPPRAYKGKTHWNGFFRGKTISGVRRKFGEQILAETHGPALFLPAERSQKTISKGMEKGGQRSKRNCNRCQGGPEKKTMRGAGNTIERPSHEANKEGPFLETIVQS